MPEIQEQLRKDKGLGKLGQTLLEQLQSEDGILEDLKKEFMNRPYMEQKGTNNSRGTNSYWEFEELGDWLEKWPQDNMREIREYYEQKYKLDKNKEFQEKGDFPGSNNHRFRNYKYELDRDMDNGKSNSKSKNYKENKGSQYQGNWDNIKQENIEKYKRIRDYLSGEYKISS